MKNTFLIVLILSFLIMPAGAFAHPGKLDARGGHVCRTNCEKWGFKTGEWHKHKDVAATVKKAKVVAKIAPKVKAKAVTKNKVTKQ
jgi:hypothetical protein